MRVYDAEELAVNTTERFNDRPWEYRVDFPFTWPRRMRNVGDSLAVAYGSDKWKKPGPDGERPGELYKHLAEARNRALVRPGLLVDYHDPDREWKVRGPLVDLDPCPMPAHVSILGMCEEVDLKLYTSGTDSRPAFGGGKNSGVVKVSIRHGWVGAGVMQFGKGGEKGTCPLSDADRQEQPFIFVYTETQGVQIIIVGDELDVKRDGIVG
ncbi:MAG: hypothetical protein GY772_17385 [bacterium]|nr:hypothetical protein [bacterium]